MLLTAFESATIHTLCTPPPAAPHPPKIAAYVIVGERGGGGAGGKTIVFESREFFWDLILWFYAVLSNYVWGAVYLLN